MIDRLVIENYKSIESLTLDLGRVTVLIGANGSGKSNILESIALCSAVTANKLDNEFLFSRGIRVPEDLRHLFPAFDEKREATIRVSIYTDDELLVSSSVAFDQLDRRIRGSEELIWKYLKSTFKNATNSTSTLSDFPPFPPREFVGFYEPPLSRMQAHYEKVGIASFLPYAIENSALRRFEEEGQIQPLGIRGEGLFKLLTVLARPENRDRLDDIQEHLELLDWFDGFKLGDNIALGERTLRIRDQFLDGDLAYITQRSANEGFLFLLFYFTLFVAKETPRFFAIDNIDASLNPKLCAELLRQLTALAEKYDKQVILTTHNPAILDGLNLHDDTQRLYVVERDLEGRTKARRIQPRDTPGEKPVRLSEAFLRGYIGGLPLNF